MHCVISACVSTQDMYELEKTLQLILWRPACLMDSTKLLRVGLITLIVLLLFMCRYSSAQDGGCSPDPPNTLNSSHPTHLLSNNVPKILMDTPDSIFRLVIGGYGTDTWAVFSESQVRQFGLWCQVREVNTNNMPDSNIGDWYYPTASGGFTIYLPTLLMMALHTSH